MAKTIKEMAISSERHCVERESYELGYEDGAYAVLAEIETCLKEPSMIQGYSDILAKVQELKGD